MKTLTISKGYLDWTIELKFDYDVELKDWIKGLPTIADYDGAAKTWTVAASLKDTIKERFISEGYEVREDINYANRQTLDAWDALNASSVLKDFQLRGCLKFLTFPGKRGLLAWPTGFGKTVGAIEICKAMDYQKVLIVCPEVVRQQWIDKFDEFWPEHPPIGLIKYGRQRKLSKPKTKERDVSYAAPYQVVGLSLLKDVSRTGWEMIIFDECHKLASPASLQSKEATQRTKLGRRTHVLGLSATPSPTKPTQIFGILNVLHPGCWGPLSGARKDWSFKFNHRYMLGAQTGYNGAWEWPDIDERRMPELRSRLETCLHRPTADEMREAVPTKPVYDVIRVDVGRIKKHSEAGSLLHECGKKKVKDAAEWTQTQMESTDSGVAVFCWHRDTTELLAKALGCPAIHGGVDAARRAELVQQGRAHGCLVATMGALGIGIDLGFFQHLLIAELYSSAEALVQAMGRIGGLRAKDGYPPHINFLVAKDTVDERVAWLLKNRLEQTDAMYELDDSSKQLQGLLDVGSIEESLNELFLDEELLNLGEMFDE